MAFAKTLIIRADASEQIGMGHLMRGIALGQAWKDMNGEVIFITACQNESMLTRLNQEQFIIHKLTKPYPDQSDWNCTRKILAKYRDSWVVLDGYHFDEKYQLQVKENGNELLVIDDMAHLKNYCADLILNQNLGAERIHYNCGPYTKMLLGSRYLLLRREFTQNKEPRVINKIGTRVLVTLGGSDLDNFTLKVIHALQEIHLPNIEATIVVGASNPHYCSLEAAAIESRIPIRLTHDATNMKDLMVKTDIAIASAGTTSWELLFLGTPSLLMIATANQCYSADQIGRSCAGINLGWIKDISEQNLTATISSLLQDYELRNKLNRISRLLIDKWGRQRVLNFMQKERVQKVSLRPVNLSDCHLIWEWTNDTIVRSGSFCSKPIPLKEHRKWFNERLGDLNSSLYIIIVDKIIPVGLIRFDKSGQGAEIGINIAATFRGCGYSYEAITMGSSYLFQESDIPRIYAHIKPDNIASLKAFNKAGYKTGNKLIFKGCDAIEMTLNRNEV
jgi:UDP-2,4-diacetamido-2,4,6-trideoxy-beta-L-altropyranose hydrolase